MTVLHSLEGMSFLVVNCLKNSGLSGIVSFSDLLIFGLVCVYAEARFDPLEVKHGN